MARQKKNREVNIVHFSFFDLLFGAFGAFVFLMIMQVLATVHLVDADIQKLIDQTVAEKNVLKEENRKLRNVEATLAGLQERYAKLAEERVENRKEIAGLQQQIVNLNGQLEELLDRNKDAASYKKLSEQTQRKLDEVMKQLDQLAGEKREVEKTSQALKQQSERLAEELAAMKQELGQTQDQKKAFESLEQKAARLHQINEELTQAKKDLATQLAALEEQLKKLEHQVDSYKRRGDVITSMEAKNRQLEKSLEDARKKVAAMRREPLEIITRNFPPTFKDGKIHLALAAQGGTPPYRWKVLGELPTGLSFDGTKGVISGVSGKTGTFKFNLEVRDAIGEEVKLKTPVELKLLSKPKQDKSVSYWFLIAALILTLWIIREWYRKHKAKKEFQLMIDKGYRPEWVKRV